MARKDKEKEKIEQEVVENETVDTNESAVEPDKIEKAELTPEEKLAEINDKYLRLYSDFDNFRKRSIKEKADIIGMATANLMKDLLTVLDDFDRAIDNNKKSEDLDGVKEGFKLIHNKFDSILKSKGLEVVDATNEVFNADLHEAITNIPAPNKSDIGKVIDCVEKGYNLKGKPLRFAKVVVGQ